LVRVPPGFEDEFAGASALATECFLNIGLLAGGVQAATQQLIQSHGLPSMAAFNVLSVLEGAGEPIPPSTIADRMLVSRPTITGLLDSLERRRLVRRATHARDGRMRLVRVTPRGTRIVRAVMPDLHRFERELMTVLGDRDLQRLLAIVATLQHHLPAVAPETALKISG
jgi:DNA-binding MarR family transcriptional regulator